MIKLSDYDITVGQYGGRVVVTISSLSRNTPGAHVVDIGVAMTVAESSEITYAIEEAREEIAREHKPCACPNCRAGAGESHTHTLRVAQQQYTLPSSDMSHPGFVGHMLPQVAASCP